MATNTLAGINIAQIAALSLAALLPRLPLINGFVTDFSADVAQVGESVTTRFPTAMTAASAASGYTSQSGVTTARTITLSNHIHTTVGFTDAEAAKAGLDLLERIFIEPLVNAVTLSMTTTLLNLVTAANFSQEKILSAANFDADAVANLQQLLNTAKAQREGRMLILLPTYIESLVKDNAIQNYAASGSTEAIREGIVGRCHGFNVSDYTDIPTNSENLVGIACGKQALCIAARVPGTPVNWAGEAVTVRDPASGLSLQIRRWYEGVDGQSYLTGTLIFGVQIGVTGNLYRILSA